MKRTLLLLSVLFIACSVNTFAQQAPAGKELTDLLNTFLKGASVSDAAVHNRFWAEDLIYTSSSGERFGKKQIMDGLAENSDEDDSGGTTSSYSAEDIRIQQYGDMAVVAFRLVSKMKTEEGTNTNYYLNSGTFLKRNGKWKAVNWQATKIPGE